MFMKKILLTIAFSICLVNSSNAEIYKLGKLKIDLFDPNKLIKSTGVVNESFGIARIKIFAEKTSDNKTNCSGGKQKLFWPSEQFFLLSIFFGT